MALELDLKYSLYLFEGLIIFFQRIFCFYQFFEDWLHKLGNILLKETTITCSSLWLDARIWLRSGLVRKIYKSLYLVSWMLHTYNLFTMYFSETHSLNEYIGSHLKIRKICTLLSFKKSHQQTNTQTKNPLQFGG